MTASAMRVLIVGGSGGIGSATARACAARGAWPVVAYCAGEEAARQTIAECGRGEALRLDLRLTDFGRNGDLPHVDAVVHAAGAISDSRSLLDDNEPELKRLLAVNALGPLRLTRALLDRGARLAHIVFVLSTAIACRGSGPYAVSKTAALATAKLLAGELAGRGVRVHALAPGWTDTRMACAAARASGRDLDAVRAVHPGGRILDPADVGELCCKLLLDPPECDVSQLVLWDLRVAPDPVWHPMDSVLAFDRAELR